MSVHLTNWALDMRDTVAGPAAELVQAAKPPPRVKRHRAALAISLIMLVNLLSMPFKAYLSEPWPWDVDANIPPSPSNFTVFNTSALARFQREYNHSTLPHAATFYLDTAQSLQVLRTVLETSNKPPMSANDCPSRFLVGLPGSIYFGESMRSLVCAFAAADHKLTNWSQRGTCGHTRMLTINLGEACLWLVAGNDVLGRDTTSTYTLYYVLRVYAYPEWLWLKLLYRVFLTCYVLRLLWRRYYGPYLQLERILAVHGHRTDLKNAGAWRYVVVLGDPTALVLMNTNVALAFLLDIWISSDTLGVAILRSSQNQDIPLLLISFLYLSRVVWIAYAAICLVSRWLKRHGNEHRFAQVDPTLLAVLVSIYGPLLTWLGSNVSFFLSTYSYLLECLLTDQDEAIEVFLVAVFYMVLMGSMPLLYGFSVRHLRPRKVAPLSRSFYASWRNNNAKNRLLFTAFGVHHRRKGHGDDDDDLVSLGGTLYSIFELNPKYQASPAICSRAADVFLLCYENDVLQAKIRLSLLCSLDGAASRHHAAIPDAASPSRYIVNELCRPLAQTFASVALQTSVKTSVAAPLCIIRPDIPSEWCM
ncbi:hypothetical protein SDRG_16523 [Saprolegnia diclina VS20]|uniref:Uncharacterized protein n=1 Tax=Saprolegnia diclina (strain VS20) TaxID=1156394 RepID=T0R807_SAPDV|nr:hypothetical protein SDRG_16523 [Saprolegnia diclina VS20]EQC25627.1 hypothetical protein SDRG_16523 [Saprolegnia diclina VS20]|eukprot:XP_008620959.1 hypothetical protein SDRG_16523 [Saprolegnia diclina VS20]